MKKSIAQEKFDIKRQKIVLFDNESFMFYKIQEINKDRNKTN